MTVATDVISVSVAAGALVVAVVGNRRAGQALAASRRANDLSAEANQLSHAANEVAERAVDSQRSRDQRREGTQVRVEVRQSAERIGGAFVLGPEYDPRPEPLYHALQIEVINAGEVAESLVGLYVEHLTSENDGEGYDVDLRERGDQEIRPRQRYTTALSADDLDFDSPDRLIVEARLASGRAAQSEEFGLDLEIQKHVAEHNRSARP